MWPSDSPGGAMRSTSSTSLPGRPWTPPDDVFPDGQAPGSTTTLHQNGDAFHSSPPDTEAIHAKRPRKLEIRAVRPDHTLPESPELSATEFHSKSASQVPVRTHAFSNMSARNTHPFVTEPLTPTRTPSSSGLLPSKDMQPYPHTPESMRTTKSQELRSLSPLPSMPWDMKDSCSSPMQEALLAHASNLETLIMSREPTNEQMAYLISKFDEMAGFLTAPDAQSKQTDDHLFSDLEDSPEIQQGLGIIDEEPATATTNGENPVQPAANLALSRFYIQEVGAYIEGVRKHVQDLTERIQEVRQLNEIQRDVIGGLRQDLLERAAKAMQEEDEPESEQESEQEIDTAAENDVPLLLPQGKGFWAAVAEALDSLGDMMHEV